MKYVYLLLLLFSQVEMFSQIGFNADSFKVTAGDLTTNTFEKDSLASALVIYEYGKSYIDKESFWLKTEIKVKVKILSKEGLDHANIEVPLYVDGSKQTLSNITGASYNIENGAIVSTRLEKKQIFTEKYNDSYDIVKFLIPNVKVGSVIIYSYLKSSPYVNKYYPWSFQESIPKLYSEYNTSIPGNYDYHIKLVGDLKLESNAQSIEKYCLEGGRGSSADCAIAKYSMRNIPAFRIEEHITTADNYRSRIEYELKTVRGFTGSVKNYAKTWETVDKELSSAKNMGSQLKSSKSYKNLLPEDISSLPKNLEKAQQINRYVQDNFTWNNTNRNYEESVKNLIDEKSGTATEINMLLYNILLSNDLEVYPVLISTRENGFPTKIYPVITDFNYLLVLLKIDNNSYLLDATDPYLAFGELPFKCLNQDGRVMDFKSGSYWMDLVPAQLTTTIYRADLEFTNDSTISGKLKTTSSGYQALSLKKSYYANPTQYVENLDNKLSNFTFSNHKVLNPDRKAFNFEEEADINWELDVIGNKIYLNPIFIKFIDSNPFKLQERTYPIDFGYKSAFLFNVKIKLNNKFQVKELPKEENLALPNGKGSLLFKVDAGGDELNIYFKFNLNETLYASEYYPYLKAYMDKILTISNNSFVLLEKNE